MLNNERKKFVLVEVIEMLGLELIQALIEEEQISIRKYRVNYWRSI